MLRTVPQIRTKQKPSLFSPSMLREASHTHTSHLLQALCSNTHTHTHTWAPRKVQLLLLVTVASTSTAQVLLVSSNLFHNLLSIQYMLTGGNTIDVYIIIDSFSQLQQKEQMLLILKSSLPNCFKSQTSIVWPVGCDEAQAPPPAPSSQFFSFLSFECVPKSPHVFQKARKSFPPLFGVFQHPCGSTPEFSFKVVKKNKLFFSVKKKHFKRKTFLIHQVIEGGYSPPHFKSASSIACVYNIS